MNPPKREKLEPDQAVKIVKSAPTSLAKPRCPQFGSSVLSSAVSGRTHATGAQSPFRPAPSDAFAAIITSRLLGFCRISDYRHSSLQRDCLPAINLLSQISRLPTMAATSAFLVSRTLVLTASIGWNSHYEPTSAQISRIAVLAARDRNRVAVPTNRG